MSHTNLMLAKTTLFFLFGDGWWWGGEEGLLGNKKKTDFFPVEDMKKYYQSGLTTALFWGKLNEPIDELCYRRHSNSKFSYFISRNLLVEAL